MTDDQPLSDKFREDIEAVVARYRHARCLSYAEAIGVLHLIIMDLVLDEQDGEEE